MTQIMAKTPIAPKTYEEAVKQLEAIIAAMQSDELPLEESLLAYKQGNELIQFCQEKLLSVEQQLKMLEGDQLVDLDLDDHAS